jgi:spore germination protein KC
LELNARAFVTAVAFDRPATEEADPSEFLLSVQIPVPAKMGGEGGDGGGGGGGDQPFVVFGTTAKLVQIGIRQLQRQIDRELFFGHTQLILINVEVAKTIGVDRLLDYFKRDFRVQRMTKIAIIDGVAREILNLQPPISQTPSAYIENLLSAQSGSAINYISDFGRFLVEQSEEGTEPVLPRLSMGKETVQTGGAAVIHKGKFAGWLSNLETRGLNILLNQNITSNYEVACPLHPRETIVVGAENFRAHHRLREIDGQTTYLIKVRGKFETVEFSEKHGPLAVLQDDLEKVVSATVQAELEQTIRRAQELGADILGVGRHLQAFKPDLWRRMKSNWGREFSAFPIKVEVKMEWAMTVRRLGG